MSNSASVQWCCLRACTLCRGIAQGCLLSGILFQFYNSDLIDGYDPKRGETAVAFGNDALILTCVKTIREANIRIEDMMEWPCISLESSHMHHCRFAMDKFGVMGLTRKKKCPIQVEGHSPTCSKVSCLLTGSGDPPCEHTQVPVSLG